MILDPHAEAQPTLTDTARQLLESVGADVTDAITDAPHGPGPGDETVMSWARAM